MAILLLLLPSAEQALSSSRHAKMLLHRRSELKDVFESTRYHRELSLPYLHTCSAHSLTVLSYSHVTISVNTTEIIHFWHSDVPRPILLCLLLFFQHVRTRVSRTQWYRGGHLE
jgi:hypothetical protein